MPCGVDTGLFTPDGPAAPAAAGPPRLLALGRLVERKGVTTVIAALARLPDAELVVAGGPDQRDLDGNRDYRPCARPRTCTALRNGLSSPAASPGPMCRRSSAPRT